MSLRIALYIALAGCAAETTSRPDRIVNILADDNYEWSLRDPELVALKLKKMQRGPYEWLRGTAALFWQDVTERGGDRTATAFGDARSSRVLLIGDPHLENVGTFRASDGMMFVDWNDFDATGYGPYGVDVRRLATSFVIVAGLGAPSDAALPDELARAVATSYAARIAELAAGARVGVVTFGAAELFDDELDKAQSRGDTNFAVDELAPVMSGVRALALGDLEAVGSDDVFEDRVLPVTIDQRTWIDAAIAARYGDKLDAGAIKLAARRIGSGVASYAAYRFQVVLEGPTASPDDDRIVELKETRDGLAIQDVWHREASEWNTPAARAVATQLRLHARNDGDALLGAAQVSGLSLKLRDREAYQRGIDAEDVADLAIGKRAQLVALAQIYGGMLARGHGQAATADGEPGHAAIAPLLADREAAFADEIAAFAIADAAQIVADHAAMRDRDLAALIAPRSR